MISFGATARGAVTALFALGVHDVTVYVHRDHGREARVLAEALPPRTLTY